MAGSSAELLTTLGWRRFAQPPLGDGARIVPRDAVIAIVDYEDRPRFDYAPPDFVTDFFDPGLKPSVAAVLAQWGAPFRRVGGGGQPPIVRLTAAEAALDDQARIDLVAKRLVEDVFGPAVFRATPQPLTICVDNFTDEAGAYRTGAAHVAGGDIPFDFLFVAQHANLATRVHEFLHTWGALDTYGHDLNRNGRHSLMAGTVGPPNDRTMLLPDPWHRMAAGLTRPAVIELDALLEADLPVSIPLPAAGSRADMPAVILWRQSHGDREFFMVELRDSSADLGSIQWESRTTSGFVVWLVKVDASGVPVIVSPQTGVPGADRAILTVGSRNNLEQGGWDPWVPAGSPLATPTLQWLDGTSAGFQLTFELDVADSYARGTATAARVFEIEAEIHFAPAKAKWTSR